MKMRRKQLLITFLMGLTLGAPQAMANQTYQHNDRFLWWNGDSCARMDSDPITNGNVKGTRLSSTTAAADSQGINYSTAASSTPQRCMRVGNIAPAAGAPVRGAYVANDTRIDNTGTIRTTTTHRGTRY